MGVHVSRIPSDAPAWLTKLDHNLYIAKCAAVSSLSIAAYDWFACLDEEIDLIWRASHSVFKYLVLFSRYMGIVFPLVTVIGRLGDWNAQQCHQLKPLIAVCSTLVLLSADFCLGLRTAAIHSFDRKVSAVIALVLLVETGAAIYATTGWITLNLPPEIPGCFFRPGTARSLGVSLYWIPSSVTDVTVFVLTVSKVFPIWSSTKESRLSWVILRDEIMYYGIITSLTIATNILMYSRNETLGPILAPVTLTLAASLVFHLALNLRSIDRYPFRASQEAPIPMEQILATTFDIPRPASHDSNEAGQSEIRSRFSRRHDREIPNRDGADNHGESQVQVPEPARARGRSSQVT